MKLESRTEDKELVAAATFAAYKEEVDAIITLAANDEEKYDDAIALVANKSHVNVGLDQENQRVQVDRRESPNCEGCQDKKEHRVQAYH